MFICDDLYTIISQNLYTKTGLLISAFANKAVKQHQITLTNKSQETYFISTLLYLGISFKTIPVPITTALKGSSAI